ncbi:MAG: tetrahydromethanopterin S-methyltransferase subunit G [Candidatus Methanoperedens sp.]
MDYDSIMKRLDKIEEKVEFSSAEILQQRGTTIGRWIGFLYGVVVAMLILNISGL